MTKKRMTILSVLCLVGLVSWRATPEEPIHLRGQVISDALAMPGVEAQIRGEGRNATLLTDDDGWFEFDLPPGSYELETRLVGFQTVVIRDLTMSGPPQRPLTVWLPRALNLGDEPLIKSPGIVPAPPLDISFRLDPSPVSGMPVRGVVTLANLGAEPLLVPARERLPSETNRSLSLNLSALSRDYGVSFNAWYACVPSVDCRKLGKGEKVSFEIAFGDFPSDGDRPAVYGRKAGSFVFEVVASFIPPGPEDVRTEAVAKRYRFKLPGP